MPLTPPATAVAAVEWVEVAGQGFHLPFISTDGPVQPSFSRTSLGRALTLATISDHNSA
jgi:hypothetical protein